MNAASIAMAASLFNDKPTAPRAKKSTRSPSKGRKSPVLFLSTTKKSSNDFEDDTVTEDFTTSTIHNDGSDNEKSEDLFRVDYDDSLEERDENATSNGTGLIMYATSTGTKTPYWKRRLGWKPDTTRAHRQKLKNLFRTPMRRHATVGLSQANQGDALLLKRREDGKQLQSNVSDRELVHERDSSCNDREQRDPNEEYAMDSDDQAAKEKNWQSFRSVNQEFVFA
ncbi:unnamed protein product [Cylindrotheca closterium]|uniref:Uncharacterized protein n=1 Tax=Cylindrotheca closterium TaxID=2856 RepID=A0AAD2FKC1_9STRA|nr:unnamed protein product [Cylindrotheca closterium]